MAPSFGNVLRKARDVRGLSSTETARRAGISPAYLSRLENDTVKRPSPEVLHHLSEAVGVPYAELMALAGYRVPGIEEEPDTKRLSAALFADVTEDELEELVAYLAWYRSRKHARASKTAGSLDAGRPLTGPDALQTVGDAERALVDISLNRLDADDLRPGGR
jgi:transcriptional regulator with XRE-family HTH domain